ncbi:MAG: hypothetical protein GY811_08160 [Myxococcales bacterium]|nr:hypothetical protein [Myxococcales bacterium]
MASRAKNSSSALNSDDTGELLDDLHRRIDRCKVLFEQYFLGIQKTAPNQLHVKLERRIRELTQLHIRNTGQRYRFTTLSQKFASYNTYWKRTMRQIEAGTYIRDMARLERKVARTGKDVPDEVLSKMPKRMRDRILKERKRAADRAALNESREQNLRESGKVRNNTPGNVHQLDEGDLLGDADLDSIFSSMLGGEESPPAGGAAAAKAPPASAAEAPPAPAAKASGRSRTRNDDDTDVDSLFAAISPGAGPVSDDTTKTPPPTPPQRERPSPRRAAPARTPSPARTPAPAPPVKPPPGMSVPESQALYKRYKKARELVGENTANLSYDKLMRSLNKQAPKIIEQHKAKAVSFNVEVKGDRVVLKAKPKK